MDNEELQYQMSLPSVENVTQCYVFVDRFNDETGEQESAIRLTEFSDYPNIVLRFGKVLISPPSEKTGESGVVFDYDILDNPDGITNASIQTQAFTNLLADILLNMLEQAAQEQIELQKLEVTTEGD